MIRKVTFFFIAILIPVFGDNYFNKFEKKFFSQYGEDGVIEKVFELIGTDQKTFVDIGAGDGFDISNTYFLRTKGWKGIGIDGRYSIPDRNIYQHWITAENILQILEQHQVSKAFDFLSIDIDSTDLYVLAQILKGGYKPRLICAEYNASFGPTDDRVVFYSPSLTWNGSWYFGATYTAFKKILAIFDYIPIATTKEGVNVFFIEKQNLHLLKDVFIGSDLDIYHKANYNTGPFGGHPVDNLQRVFGSSEDVRKYIGL